MASYDVPAADALTTDVGTEDGYLTVASNAGFFPNALVWMTLANGSDGGQYQIVDLVGTTKIGLRLATNRYGRSSLTSFLTGSKISQPDQLVQSNANAASIDPAAAIAIAESEAAAALATHAALTETAHGGGVLSTAQKSKVVFIVRMEFQCANDFDPSVSGFIDPDTGAIPPIGSRMTSLDGTKHFNKWGAGTTQWAAEHEITATLGGPRSTIACSDFTGSLACDTLGGFVWNIWGTLTRPGAAPNLFFTFNHTGSTPSGNKMRGFNNGVVVNYTNSAILWSIGTGTFRITVEALANEILSTAGTLQKVRVTAESGTSIDNQLFIVRTGTQSEITNPGLVLDSGATFDAGCKVSLHR